MVISVYCMARATSDNPGSLLLAPQSVKYDQKLDVYHRGLSTLEALEALRIGAETGASKRPHRGAESAPRSRPRRVHRAAHHHVDEAESSSSNDLDRYGTFNDGLFFNWIRRRSKPNRPPLTQLRTRVVRRKIRLTKKVGPRVIQRRRMRFSGQRRRHHYRSRL